MLNGNLESLGRKGSHRSKQYQRLYSRRKKQRLSGSYGQSSLSLLQLRGPAAKTCYALARTQTARHILTQARLLRLGT